MLDSYMKTQARAEFALQLASLYLSLLSPWCQVHLSLIYDGSVFLILTVEKYFSVPTAISFISMPLPVGI